MIIGFLDTPQGFKSLSTFGVLCAVVGTIITAIAYRGEEGELYSPINHFISELGKVGVSRLAWVFNLGLITCGISLVGSSISLGLILTGFLAKIGMVIGILCSISLAFVGIFPMNKRNYHSHAALIFFRAGLWMMIAFNLAIAFQPAQAPVLPRLYSLAGLPPILSFSGFLFLINKVAKESADPLSTEDGERPKVWLLAMMEWSIFVTITAWFVIITLGL